MEKLDEILVIVFMFVSQTKVPFMLYVLIMVIKKGTVVISSDIHLNLETTCYMYKNYYMNHYQFLHLTEKLDKVFVIVFIHHQALLF